MKIDELIQELEQVKEKHGNLEVDASTKGPPCRPYGWELELYVNSKKEIIDL